MVDLLVSHAVELYLMLIDGFVLSCHQECFRQVKVRIKLQGSANLAVLKANHRTISD